VRKQIERQTHRQIQGASEKCTNNEVERVWATWIDDRVRLTNYEADQLVPLNGVNFYFDFDFFGFKHFQ
jgi:hypothetical protein